MDKTPSRGGDGSIHGESRTGEIFLIDRQHFGIIIDQYKLEHSIILPPLLVLF